MVGVLLEPAPLLLAFRAVVVPDGSRRQVRAKP